MVPFGFRRQVSQVTQGLPPEPLSPQARITSSSDAAHTRRTTSRRDGCWDARPTLMAGRNAARRLLGGEPCAGEPHARFGEGGLETEPPVVTITATAPALYSTARRRRSFSAAWTSPKQPESSNKWDPVSPVQAPLVRGCGREQHGHQPPAGVAPRGSCTLCTILSFDSGWCGRLPRIASRSSNGRF
jgi:hypothetical protein